VPVDPAGAADVDAARAAGIPVALFAPDGTGIPGADAVFTDYRALPETLVKIAERRPTN